MLNTEQIKKLLEEFQKKSEKDNKPPWETLDEIYGNPLIRAYCDGYDDGWCNYDKAVYTCNHKEQYQEFYDAGYKDGQIHRLEDENFNDDCSKHKEA